MKPFILGALLCTFGTIFGTTPHAYVTELGGNAISIIDINRNTVQKIFGFTHPHVVHVTNDGTAAYVGDDFNNILKIRCIQHTVSNIGQVSGHPVALCMVPDASRLYTANSNDTVNVVDLVKDQVVGEISGFAGPQDIRCTPDGAFVYVTNKANGTISVIDTFSNTIVQTIKGLVNPVGITFNIDGTFAYVTDTAHNSLYVIRISDNTIVDIVLGFNQPKYAVVTPDKTKAYVSNGGNNTVSIVRTEDNFIIGTIPIPDPNTMGITPDGLYLLVGSSYGEVFKIELLDNTIEVALSGFSNPSNISVTVNNAPADTVNGWQVVADDPLVPYNQITWRTPDLGPNPDPTMAPTQFRIFRDFAYTNLVAVVPFTTVSIPGVPQYLYNDLNREIGQTYSYYVIADFPNGYSASLGNIDISPSRVGIKRL